MVRPGSGCGVPEHAEKPRKLDFGSLTAVSVAVDCIQGFSGRYAADSATTKQLPMPMGFLSDKVFVETFILTMV